MNHTILVTIGDFSCDGHKHLIEYYVRSNKPRDDVRDAWFEARKRLPECCPSSFCREFGDAAIPPKTLDALAQREAPIPANAESVKPIEMLRLVMWFAMQGDPDLRLEEIVAEPLFFCGSDRKGRYQGSVGYGLFDIDWEPDENAMRESRQGK